MTFGSELSFRALVECLSESLIVLDQDRRVHFANAAAEGAFRQNTGLYVRGGLLVASERDLQVRLARAIAGAVAKPGITCAVLLDPEADRSCAVLHLSLLSPKAERLWLIGRLCNNAPGAPDLDVVRQTFGLSQTEAEIALEISEGHTPRRIALGRASSEETVRWHIKNIYSKTYTNRLADLTRQLSAARSPFIGQAAAP